MEITENMRRLKKEIDAAQSTLNSSIRELVKEGVDVDVDVIDVGTIGQPDTRMIRVECRLVERL